MSEIMDEIIECVKNMNDEDMALLSKFNNYEKMDELYEQLSDTVAEYINFIVKKDEDNSSNPFFVNVLVYKMLKIFKVCIEHKDLLNVKTDE